MYCSISLTQTSKKRKFSSKYPRYFNDLTVKHFSTPNRAKIHLAFAKQKYNYVRKNRKRFNKKTEHRRKNENVSIFQNKTRGFEPFDRKFFSVYASNSLCTYYLV